MVNQVCNRQARAASHFALRKDFQGEPLCLLGKLSERAGGCAYPPTGMRTPGT